MRKSIVLSILMLIGLFPMFCEKYVTLDINGSPTRLMFFNENEIDKLDDYLIKNGVKDIDSGVVMNLALKKRNSIVADNVKSFMMQNDFEYAVCVTFTKSQYIFDGTARYIIVNRKFNNNFYYGDLVKEL